MSALAGKYNFTLPCGSDFALTLTYKDRGVAVDIRGWTARSQVRHPLTGTLLFEPTITFVDPAKGVFCWSANWQQTEGLTRQPAEYDVVLTRPDGSPGRPIRGTIELVNAVTRLNSPPLTTLPPPVLAPSVAVGAVTALPAGSHPFVENVGSSVNAVFNFGIPAGERGSVESELALMPPQDPVNPVAWATVMLRETAFKVPLYL